MEAVTSRVRASSSRRAVDHGERLWQLFAVLCVGGLLWWFFTKHDQTSERNFLVTSGSIGIGFGVLAGTLSVRKRFAYQGVGRMSAWLTGHIYLGLIAAVAVFLHSGMRPGGSATSILFLFFCLTIASGLIGLLIAKRVPPLLTKIEENPALIEDLVDIRGECLRGLHELANGGSQEFRKLVKERLLGEVNSLSRMLRFYQKRTTLAEELPAFQRGFDPVVAQLKPHEQGSFRRAAEYALRANKMNAEYLLQRMLRGWLTFHMAATAIMFALAAVHIFTVLFY